MLNSSSKALRRFYDTVGSIDIEELAERASKYVLNPQRNPLLERWQEELIQYNCIRPKLGIFNDIPWYKLREDEVRQWARAGFEVIICDGEHSDWQGTYGREHFDLLLRFGLTPIQRLSRDARSRFAECLGLGARGCMLPYATSLNDVDQFLDSIFYPDGINTPSMYARGAYPIRDSLGVMNSDPEHLRRLQQHILPVVQFESTEILLNSKLRRATLSRLHSLASDKTSNISALAFVGAMDLSMRALPLELTQLDPNHAYSLSRAISEFPRCATGGIFGHPSDSVLAVQSYRRAIHSGARLLCVPFLTSDLPYFGAVNVVEPYFEALNSSSSVI